MCPLEQVTPKECARPVQPCLDRLFGDVEAGAGFGGAEPFDFAQDEHRSVRIGSWSIAGAQQVPQLAGECLPFRIRFRRADRHRRRLLSCAGLERDGSSLAPHPGERFVQCDPCEPGRELSPSLERREMQVGIDVGLLHHVLDFRFAAEDGAHRPIDALVVPAHQHFEQRAVPGQHPRDDRIVGQLARFGGWVTGREHRVIPRCCYRVPDSRKVPADELPASHETCRPLATPLRREGNMRTKDIDIAWRLLRYGLGTGAFLAGLDKFFNLLTTWTMYLNPLVLRFVPVSADVFMRSVGVVEMAVGAAILTRWPREGAAIASIWLLSIAVNLLTQGAFFDVAVRDVEMAIGAAALALLSNARLAASQAPTTSATTTLRRSA